MRSRRLVELLLVAALAGIPACSEPDRPASDGDADQDGDDDTDGLWEIEPPDAPEPPLPPELPRLPESGPELPQGPAPALLTPCPEGWREVVLDDSGGVAACEPWPVGGRAECDDAQAHFPGEPGCTTVGAACPAGEWAEGLPETGVLYVRADALAGGAGTREAPFAAISDAAAAAAAGSVIALSQGTFDEMVEIPEGVTLWGACVAETWIVSTEPGADEATVTARAPGAVVRDLRVGGVAGGILVAGAGASLRAEGVVVEGTTGRGIEARDQGLLELDTVVIRGTRYQSSWTDGAVRASDMAQVTGRRLAIDHNSVTGVSASGGRTRVLLEDAAIGDMECGDGSNWCAHGVWAGSRARVEVSRVVLERNRGTALAAIDEDTVLAAQDVIVRTTRDVLQGDPAQNSSGIGVGPGARAEVTRALVDRSENMGVLVWGQGAELELSDVVVWHTLARKRDRLAGLGMVATQGATCTASRALIQGNTTTGAWATDDDTELVLEDVTVRGTQSIDRPGSEQDGLLGRGLEVGPGGTLVVTRGLVESNRDVGIAAIGAGAEALLGDVVVRETHGRRLDGLGGQGVNVALGASCTLRRGLLETNHAAGAAASGEGTTLELEEVTVRDTLSLQSWMDGLDGLYGRGIEVGEGARLVVTRGLVERNRDVGIVALNAGTQAHLEDVIVRDTTGRRLDGLGGQGVAAAWGATCRATRCLLQRNVLAGAVAGPGGALLVLEDVTVTESRSTNAPDTEWDGMFGRGIEVGPEGRLVVRRALVKNNRDIGIAIIGASAHAGIEDVVVRDTVRSEGDGLSGLGLIVSLGGSCTLGRALVQGNHGVGVGVYGDDSLLGAADLVVRDTRGYEAPGQPLGGWGGTGLEASEGASVEVTRALVERNRQLGVAGFSPGTEMTLSDIEVRDTLPMECAATTCVGLEVGTGVGAYGGAHLEMGRFLVTGNALCGVQAGHGAYRDEQGVRTPFPDGGTLDLHEGEVSTNLIGAAVTTEGFDLRRLMDRVIYVDNQRNLDSSELPVPDTGLSDIEAMPEL